MYSLSYRTLRGVSSATTFRPLFVCLMVIMALYGLTGCSLLPKNSTAWLGMQEELRSETRQFFVEHPEYLRSEIRQERLFSEFRRVVNKPENSNLSIYNMLLLAHHNLIKQPVSSVGDVFAALNLAAGPGQAGACTGIRYPGTPVHIDEEIS